jgi:hypothetical protein
VEEVEELIQVVEVELVVLEQLVLFQFVHQLLIQLQSEQEEPEQVLQQLLEVHQDQIQFFQQSHQQVVEVEEVDQMVMV